MYDFITGTLFLTVLSLSLSGALTGILIAAIRPLTGKYFSKKWNYYIWLLVVVRLMIPFHFESVFPGLPHFHAQVSQNNDIAQPDNANMIQPDNNQTQSDGTVLPDGNQTQSDSMSLPDDDLAQSDHFIQHENDLAQSDSMSLPDNALTQSNRITLPDSNSSQPSDITLPGDDLAQSGKTTLPDGDSAQSGNMILSDGNQTQPSSTILSAISTASLLTAAALIWLGGVVLALIIKLLQYFRFQSRLKKDSTRITDCRVTAMENAFCAKLHIKRAPILYESTTTYSPMTIGLWHPVIILPPTLSIDSNAADFHIPAVNTPPESRNVYQLQLILHHELVHIARKDLWYKWIYQLLLCVHWFNPVLHRISRQINSDCELSCDEAILPELTETGKQMYGNILLDTAEQGIDCRQSAFSTTLLENKRNLKRRLDAILRYKKATRFRLALSVCALVLMLVLSACSSVWFYTEDMPASESDHDSSTGTNQEPTDSPLWNFLTNAGIGSPSDSWEFYDNDEVLAGKDVYGSWEAFNYVRNNNQHLSASRIALYGTDSFAIVYADRDIDVQITSSFEIPDGNFKIIHVAPDGSVTTLNDTGEKTTQTVTMQAGRNALKMVGQGKKMNNLEIDYSGIRESDFTNVFFSEDEEYAYQVKNNLTPADKDRIIDTLYSWDEKDASEIFNTLLTSGTTFTADELGDFFIHSDPALSSKYLMEALQNKTIEPLSPNTISEIMPYLIGDCKTEVLKSLSVEDFYYAFADNIMYLDNSQRDECLMDYITRGGTLTYSMYDELSPYLDKSIKQKLDQFGVTSGDFTTHATIPETIGDIKDITDIDGIQETMSIVHESAKILHYEDGSPYIQDILTNHTDQRIIDAECCMLAYNEAGSPLKLRWNYLDSSTESSYENIVRTKADILPGQTEDDHGGWSLYDGKRTENLPTDQNGNVSQVAYTLFYLKQVVFEDGTVWNNPDYETWFKTYAGKEISVDELQNYYPHQYEFD